jgi:hypothetical protein
MKVELKIDDKIIAIKADGVITFQIREDVPVVPVPAVPVPVVPRVNEMPPAPVVPGDAGGNGVAPASVAPRVNEVAPVPVPVSPRVNEVAPAPVFPRVSDVALATRENILFGKLSDLRKELANVIGKPAYVIFQDKALWEMIEKMPSNLEEFSNISGVGQAKLEKYGVRFLEVLWGA